MKQKKSAAIRGELSTNKTLSLQDYMPHGRYIGGKIKEVIEHDPFNTMRMFRLGLVKLDRDAKKYLQKVFNRKKKGVNF